ncbi:MAG: S1C family serine protease [Pseudomonadota bacterium]
MLLHRYTCLGSHLYTRHCTTFLLVFAWLSLLPLARSAPAQTEALQAAIVTVRAQIPAAARTAAFLGTERSGSGVVIGEDGLVLTIGYLILEASEVALVDANGTHIPAKIVAYDYDTGFGLVRAESGLVEVEPISFGSSAAVSERQQVIIASRIDAPSMQPALVVSRREFAGYWEYLLENAIFTAPPYAEFAGAALLDVEGKLIGIGSLYVGDAFRASEPVPGNMFVPIDPLKNRLEQLVDAGRVAGPPRPWLGVFTRELLDRVFVTFVTPGGPGAEAGLLPKDIVLAVSGVRVQSQAAFYRELWKTGAAGSEVSVTVLRGAEVKEIVVRSGNREDYYLKDPEPDKRLLPKGSQAASLSPPSVAMLVDGLAVN